MPLNMSRECLIGRKFAKLSITFGKTLCGKNIPPMLELRSKYSCMIGLPCLNRIVYAPAIIPTPEIEINVNTKPDEKTMKFSSI